MQLKSVSAEQTHEQKTQAFAGFKHQNAPVAEMERGDLLLLTAGEQDQALCPSKESTPCPGSMVPL